MDNSNRILIFMSPIGMKILSNSTRWHLDGTFKTCPTYFHQILSIHVYYQNQMFPAGYILLQNKERETYKEALTHVKHVMTSKNVQINVQEALSDFELALLQAISGVFENVKIYGTNNHFEGYHSKLASIPSAKTNNVLTFINMIKKSATQVYSDFHAHERNPIQCPKQLSKNKKKDEIFITLQDQYNKQMLTFPQYFQKLASHVTDPYEPSPKRVKIEEESNQESNEIQYLETRSYTLHERVPICKSLLKLNNTVELNNLHITEFQNLIEKKYNVSWGSRYINIFHVPVIKQTGLIDCGFYALGYAFGSCYEYRSRLFNFRSKKIREEFNQIIETKSLFLFSHGVVNNFVPQFNEFCIDLN
ncbi:unnamed protein product [Brachionus calyciflorus]|uniref:MULE transposase domain-containing protein n=1 Tax=Brachionus calyciflorus TaxID=104777 RepID=A0A814HMK6_9BILA|nr:unnamed protein product [Brachionus calyciflorus]